MSLTEYISGNVGLPRRPGEPKKLVYETEMGSNVNRFVFHTHLSYGFFHGGTRTRYNVPRISYHKFC